MAERGGFDPPHFGNSLTHNQIAVTTEYNRLADFATESTNSTETNVSMKFPRMWTP
jgi:hypothetical protein